jgi:plasmid stabilization system protein ParE
MGISLKFRFQILRFQVSDLTEGQTNAPAFWHAGWRSGTRSAADAFEQELVRAIECIGETPTTYPTIDGELRRYAFDRFPYALLYAVGPSSVRVLAVAHLHRRPGYWRGRVG